MAVFELEGKLFHIGFNSCYHVNPGSAGEFYEFSLVDFGILDFDQLAANCLFSVVNVDVCVFPFRLVNDFLRVGEDICEGFSRCVLNYDD